MAEIEVQHSELFRAFLQKHLREKNFDGDAYLEKLIIHWGETGETFFALPPEETVSGEEVCLPFSVQSRYYIREGGQEIPVEDPEEGYDLFRPVLVFTTGEAAPRREEIPVGKLNPIALLRHKTGRTLHAVSDATGIAPEELLRYEAQEFDVGQLPLATAAAIAKALGVHAEALLTCGPAMPLSR